MTSHCIIALDTLSYDTGAELAVANSTQLTREQIRNREHLASPEIRARFEAAVRKFRLVFTPEFVDSTLETKQLRVEVVSDIRSPVEIRGRNHRISYVVFAFLDVQDATSNPEGTDLVYASPSSLKIIAQRAKSMGRADISTTLVVLVPGEHRDASLQRFKQIQFEADGQLVDLPGIDAVASTRCAFVDAKHHAAVETRRRLAFELTYRGEFYAEDTSTHDSLSTLRKLVEIGVADYAVDSRKRTIDDEPVLSVWSTFLAANREQVHDDEKTDLLALVQHLLTNGDVTQPRPLYDGDDDDDNNNEAKAKVEPPMNDIDEDLFYNREVPYSAYNDDDEDEEEDNDEDDDANNDDKD